MQLKPIGQILGLRLARKEGVETYLRGLSAAVARARRALAQISNANDAESADSAWRLNTAFMHVATVEGRYEGDDRLFVDYARDELEVFAAVLDLALNGDDQAPSSVRGGFADGAVHLIYEALLQGFAARRASKVMAPADPSRSLPKFRFWVSRSDPFAEIVRICFRAVGHDADPERAIRKYMTGGAPAQLESKFGIANRRTERPKRGRPRKST